MTVPRFTETELSQLIGLIVADLFSRPTESYVPGVQRDLAKIREQWDATGARRVWN